jgi:8-oxo-dGTP pyrophosphatase MutT (NUDIX family)
MNWKSSLKKAMERDCPYFFGQSYPEALMSQDILEWREAAVLCLFAEGAQDGEPYLLLTERSGKLFHHRGQIAFPGGSADQRDEKKAAQTALRETEEEVGVSRRDIEILGELPFVPVLSSQFLMTPVVGVLRGSMEDFSFEIQEDEIAGVFWVSLKELLNVKNYEEEDFEFCGVRYPTPAFYLEGYRIWGATAIVLKNLMDRIQSVRERD